MSWDRRPAKNYAARNAVTQFTQRNVTLPDSIMSAVAEVDRIEAEAPTPPDGTAVRRAILDGATRATLNDMLLSELSFTRLRSEYAAAIQFAAGRVLTEFHGARDSLHAALKAKADNAIAHLERVAALDGATLEQLVRAGRHEDAQALAEVEVIGAELAALYAMRDDYLTPGGLAAARAGQFDCTQWRDCRVAYRYERSELDVVGNYVHVLRQGGELWYPTSEQALSVAGALHAEWQQEAARLAAIKAAQ